MEERDRDRLIHICAWCNQIIEENEEAYGFGAKASPGVDLSDKEGEFVSLNLRLQDKTVFALVPAEESQPRKAGYDLMFITCSANCAEELKEALDLERDVFQDSGEEAG
jgi:hypothetical protein